LKPLLFVVGLFLLLLASNGVNAVTNVTACGTLGVAGEYYALARSVNSSSTCITIDADDVTLDCAYYGAQYNLTGTLAGRSYGVYLNGRANVTVKNCLVTAFETGVYVRSSTGNSLENNVVTGNGDEGFFVRSSSNNSFLNNAVNENLAGFGLEEGADSNVFANNKVTASRNNAYGIVFYYPSTGNVFSNMIVQTSGSDAYAVYVDDDNVNFSFVDSVLSASYLGTPDFYADDSGASTFGSWNFTNVAFNKRDALIERNGTLSVFWYVDGRVTDGDGNELSDVYVSASDVNGTSVFNAFTDSSGWIPRQTVLEYYQTASGVYNKTPHLFTASLAGYESGYSLRAVSSNLVDGGELSIVLTRVPAFAGGSGDGSTPQGGGKPVNCLTGDCGLVYWRELHVFNAAGIEVASSELDGPGFSTFTLIVKNVLNRTVYDVLITEVIPDSVASDPSQVYDFSIPPLSVRKGSVVVTWLFENVEPGETKNVSYRVAKRTDSQSLNDFETPKVVTAAVAGGASATLVPSVGGRSGSSGSIVPSVGGRSGSSDYVEPSVGAREGTIFEFQGASVGRLTVATVVLIVLAGAAYWFYRKRDSQA